MPLPLLHEGARLSLRCARAVDTLSLYATLCDLTGLSVPDHVEGRSLAALVSAPDAPWDGVALTSLVGHHALRTERYRYIRYWDGGEELYDHEVDPGEHTNLAAEASHAELKRGLEKQLKELVPE